MDTLSATLRVVHLNDANFNAGRFTAPWCYQTTRGATGSSLAASDADSVVIFRMITEGECYVEIDGQPPLHLVAGDAIVFPRADAHRMASAPGLTVSASANLEAELLDQCQRPQHNAGQVMCHLVSGYLACDARLSRMLLSGLPRLIQVNVRACGAGAWLEASLGYALSEARTPRPGGAGVLAKLAEVVFIEVLRIYMNEQATPCRGWQAGMGDRIVGAALHALHNEPSKPWTLEDLAHKVGASRSVLAERFQQLVGNSPIQYLTQRRMLLAANLLCDSNAPLARIAEEVGYQTDTAFSRAFRRQYGAPPATWRRAKTIADSLRTPIDVARRLRASGRRSGDQARNNIGIERKND